MDDTSRDTQLDRRDGERSRSGRTVSLFVLLLLSVVGIGAVVFWASDGQLNTSSRTATVQAATQAPPPAPAGASEDTMQSLNALQQSVTGLQASQQRMADQLDLIQRQLSSEQGERKLLSEQVGALSGRVDGRSGSTASVTTGIASQAAKKKPAPRQ